MNIYERWLSGLCPCCGGPICKDDKTLPKEIAFGVTLCGRCIANNHLCEPGATEAFLEAIVACNDEPFDNFLFRP